VAEETGMENLKPGEVRQTAETALNDITKAHDELLEILKHFDTPKKREFFPPAAVSAITRSAEVVESSIYATKQVVRLQTNVLNLILDPMRENLKTNSEALQAEIEDARRITSEMVENLSSFTREKTDEMMRTVSEMSARTSDETINSMTTIEELSTKTINIQKESVDTINELAKKSEYANNEAQVQLREMMRQSKIQGKESLAEIKRLAREAKRDIGKTSWATAAVAVLCLMGGWYASVIYTGGNLQTAHRHKSSIQQNMNKHETVEYKMKDDVDENGIRLENLDER